MGVWRREGSAGRSRRGTQAGRAAPGWLLASARRAATIPSPSLPTPVSSPACPQHLAGSRCSVAMALKLRDLNLAFCRVEGRNCPLHLGSSEPGNGPGTLSAPVMGQEGMCSVCQVAGLSCGSQTFEGLRQGQGDKWGRPRGRACASILPSPFVPFPSPSPGCRGCSFATGL